MANGLSTHLHRKARSRAQTATKELQNVFYLPGSPCNLISEGVLRSHDHHYNSKSMHIDFFEWSLCATAEFWHVTHPGEPQTACNPCKSIMACRPQPHWPSAPAETSRPCGRTDQERCMQRCASVRCMPSWKVQPTTFSQTRHSACFCNQSATSI